MRLLEMVLLGLLAVAVVHALLRRRGAGRAGTVALALLTVLALTTHAVVELVRWQLLPAYLVAAIIMAAGVAAALRPAGDRGRTHRLAAAAGIVAVAVGGGVAWAVPVPRLPQPTGAYAIGTTTFAVSDANRDDPYTRERGAPRRIAVQAWYPIDAEDARAPERGVAGVVAAARLVARRLDLPGFAPDHLALVRGHATPAAPIAGDGPFPVAVYSHGWGGLRTAQVDLVEQLASDGYVVFAVDHTHAALATVYPDGEVVPIEPDALPARSPDAAYDRAAELLVATFTADLHLLLDHIEAQPPATVASQLDLSRLAFVGHSTGGGAGLAACAEDARCRAVVGFDPWVELVLDDVIGGGMDQPVLSIRSEGWTGNANDTRLRRLHAASRGGSWLVSIDGMLHRDFTLLPFLTPVASRVGLSGSTEGARSHAIVSAYTSAFLDQTVRGVPSAILSGASPFEEATLETAPRAQSRSARPEGISGGRA